MRLTSGSGKSPGLNRFAFPEGVIPTIGSVRLEVLQP